MKRYDGTLAPLEDRPHSHPNQHAPEDIRLIDNMRRRNPNAGLVVFWGKLRQKGYRRSVSDLYRFLRKRGQMAVKPPDPKYVSKLCEQMDHPGQRVQIDVKFVPASCLVGEAAQEAKECGGHYQCTFLDEYSRFRILEAFKEHSTLFIRHPPQAHPPLYNGKVEHSHRKDKEGFYAAHEFFSFEDHQTQLSRWNRTYNHFPMRPLNWQSPIPVLSSFP